MFRGCARHPLCRAEQTGFRAGLAEKQGRPQETRRAQESRQMEQRHKTAEETRRKDAFRAEVGADRPETAAHSTRGANSGGRSPFRETRGRPRGTTGDDARSQTRQRRQAKDNRKHERAGEQRRRAAERRKAKQTGAPKQQRAARGSSGTEHWSRDDGKAAFRAELGSERAETAADGARGANSSCRSLFRLSPSPPRAPRDPQARK